MESLTVFFPLSGVETSIFLPPLVAFFVSLLASTGGLSGAFLLLPFQMSVLGFTTPAVTSTNLFYNVISIPGGGWRYFREGRIVWPLVGVMVAGTIPGTALGYYVRVRYLPDPGTFKIFVGAVLAFLSIRLLWQVFFPPSLVSPRTDAVAIHRGSVKTVSVGLGKVEYDFAGEIHSFPTVAMFILSIAVGVVGGAYGIGGGAILAPFWVAIFHLPVYTIAGASLIGTFITSIAGVLFYTFIPAAEGMKTSPDWALGGLFGVGGVVGIYCGARLQKFLPPRLIKFILGGLIALASVKYIFLG